jgi:hypothetical protein
MLNSKNRFVDFKCKLLDCLHSENKQLAMERKKLLSNVVSFLITIDKQNSSIKIRAAYNEADSQELKLISQEDFELVLKSDDIPFERYNEGQNIVAFGHLQGIEHHAKDKYCKNCIDNPNSLFREYALHDIVCKFSENTIALNSQQDSDFSIIT